MTGLPGPLPSPRSRRAARWTWAKPWRASASCWPKSGAGTSRAAFVETEPQVTQAYLQEHFVQLSTYSTVSTNTANGNSNMALALSKVNGTVLEPGSPSPTTPLWGTAPTPQQRLAACGGHLWGRDRPDVWRRHLPGFLHPVHRRPEGRHGDCGALVPRHALLLLPHRPGRHCGLPGTWTSGSATAWRPRCTSAPGWRGTTLYVSFYGCYPQEWDSVSVSSEQTGSEAPLSSVSFRRTPAWLPASMCGALREHGLFGPGLSGLL